VVAALLGAAVFVGTSASRAQEKDDAAKEKKIRKLLKVSGDLAAAKWALDNSLKSQKDNPNLPKGYIKRFKELANDDFFADISAPIYVKHFDEEDVDAFLAFYDTPAGKKLAKEKVALQKEGMEEAKTAGGKLGLKVFAELKKAQEGDDDGDDAKPDEKKPDEKKKPDRKPGDDEPR
jgi:hypothetical protein